MKNNIKPNIIDNKVIKKVYDDTEQINRIPPPPPLPLEDDDDLNNEEIIQEENDKNIPPPPPSLITAIDQQEHQVINDLQQVINRYENYMLQSYNKENIHIETDDQVQVPILSLLNKVVLYMNNCLDHNMSEENFRQSMLSSLKECKQEVCDINKKVHVLEEENMLLKSKLKANIDLYDIPTIEKEPKKHSPPRLIAKPKDNKIIHGRTFYKANRVTLFDDNDHDDDDDEIVEENLILINDNDDHNEIQVEEIEIINGQHEMVEQIPIKITPSKYNYKIKQQQPSQQVRKEHYELQNIAKELEKSFIDIDQQVDIISSDNETTVANENVSSNFLNGWNGNNNIAIITPKKNYHKTPVKKVKIKSNHGTGAISSTAKKRQEKWNSSTKTKLSDIVK